MNFVFISPNFPEAFRYFCIRLRENGVNVLGIGDAPYDMLYGDLKESLTEYYKVDSLEDYDSVLSAVGFFTWKYGKIDWIESNNEYWLELDARLRTDFNVTTGLKTPDMAKIKHKSAMKEYYRQAQIPVARAQMATTLEEGLAFVHEVGFPVVAKPDNGVGAIATYKLESDRDVERFFQDKPEVDYLMEEFVPGSVTTYDGVCNSKGEVLFAASHITKNSIMDMVNKGIPTYYYVDKKVPADVEKAGKAVLKAFGITSRCFHQEFFRLTEDKKGLGKKGDLVALEVNMRPAGGFTPDMLNFSQSKDFYQIYADMVAFDEVRHTYEGPCSYCVYAGRRDENHYKLSLQQLSRYAGKHARLFTRMPDALAGTMGNQVAIACFDTLKEVDDFVEKAFELADSNVSEDKDCKDHQKGKSGKTVEPVKKKPTRKPKSSAKC